MGHDLRSSGERWWMLVNEDWERWEVESGWMDKETLEMGENVTRDSVLALMFEKEKIESEISQIKSVLDSVSVLMIEMLRMWKCICHPGCVYSFCIILLYLYFVASM